MRLYQCLVEGKWIRITNTFSCTTFSVMNINGFIYVDCEKPFKIEKRHLQKFNNPCEINITDGEHIEVCVITTYDIFDMTVFSFKEMVIEILTSNIGTITRKMTLVWDSKYSKLVKN